MIEILKVAGNCSVKKDRVLHKLHAIRAAALLR